MKASAELNLTSLHNQITTALDKAYNGKGTSIKTPFGTTQLLSCRTGIKDTHELITGLQAKLNKGWYLKNPVITATADNYTATVLKQVRTDFSTEEKWIGTYDTPIVFPILLEGTPQKNITLTVNASWNICPFEDNEEKGCLTQQEIYTLPLSINESHSTVYCAYLNNSLKTAALNIQKTNARIQNKLLSNGNLILQLTFPKPNKSVEIQEETANRLSVISTQTEDNIWRFILKSDTPFHIGEKIPLIIRTTNGCYTAVIQIDDKPLPPLPKKLGIWSAFWIGLFFFIFSPIWCYWLAPHKLASQARELNKKIIKLQIGYFVSLLVLGILWLLNIPLYGWTNYIICIYFVLFLGIFLLFKPFQPILITCILTLLLPKPFWESIASISASAKIGLLIWCFLFPYLMFNLWRLSAKHILPIFKRFQKEKNIAYHIFVRLPYIILSTWLILTLIFLSLTNTKPIHNITQSAIIQVAQPTCITCLKDRIFTFSSLKSIPVYYLNANHELAKQKKSEHNIFQNNFNIFLTSDNREIILPTNLSTHRLKQIIQQYY